MPELTKEQVWAWKSDAIDHQGEGMNEMSPLQHACSVQATRVELLCNALLTSVNHRTESEEREFVKEVARGPYPDSDQADLMSTLVSRARTIVAGSEERDHRAMEKLRVDACSLDYRWSVDNGTSSWWYQGHPYSDPADAILNGGKDDE